MVCIKFYFDFENKNFAMVCTVYSSIIYFILIQVKHGDFDLFVFDKWLVLFLLAALIYLKLCNYKLQNLLQFSQLVDCKAKMLIKFFTCDLNLTL